MPALFTPAQANKTLPLVKRIVTDILEKGRELKRAAGESGARAQVKQLEGQLRELLLELEAIGCQYKDFGFEAGLVDFPSQIEGRDVLLCWRNDEDEVTWYHTAEDGFAGRTLIPTELLEPGD